MLSPPVQSPCALPSERHPIKIALPRATALPRGAAARITRRIPISAVCEQRGGPRRAMVLDAAASAAASSDLYGLHVCRSFVRIGQIC